MTTHTMDTRTTENNHPSTLTANQGPIRTTQEPEQKPKQEPTHSIPEAARLLGKAELTIRRMVKRQELPARQIDGPHGPEYRIPFSALAALNPALITLQTGTQQDPIPEPTPHHRQEPIQESNQEAPALLAATVALLRAEIAGKDALLAEKDRRIDDQAKQLDEENRSGSELRRLLLATHSELAELRRLALAPPLEAMPVETTSGAHDQAHGEDTTEGTAGAEQEPGPLAAREEEEQGPARPWWKFWR